ncbi:MAG: flagellar hook-associated protein FlgK [Desulfobulbus sp.]|jgi:flagellar hook-associated protein 1 FlgK
MTSLLNALGSGKTSLLSNQKSIEITGNNIANVNTRGYSRQTAEMTQIPSVNFGDFFIGQGVTVTNVNREYSLFINRQLQDKSIEVGVETGKAGVLTELERIFSVSKNNLASDINEFFDSWQKLTTNPSGLVERDIVLQRGTQLGDAFARLTSDMNTVASNLNNEIVSKVETINEQLSELARINNRITLVEVSGQTANAARDQRDMLVQDLSLTLGVQTYTDNRGMLCVQLPGGKPLVQGNIAAQLNTVSTGNVVNLQLQISGMTMDVDLDDMGGEFKGMFTARDVFMAGLRDEVNTLAVDLTSAVNTEHAQGYGADQVGGRLFFEDISALPPEEIASRRVKLAITKPSEVAAAGNPEAAPGDNSNALKIASLEVTHKVQGTNDTFETYYSQVVARVGIEASRNDLALSGAKDAALQLQNLRDGRSGVSLEEEMIDLIQYQRGFESSAKYLATVDELMAALLQLKR